MRFDPSVLVATIVCACLLQADAAGAADDVVVEVVTVAPEFDQVPLHLPGSGVALNSRSVYVEGLLIGFVGDLLPLDQGENQITLTVRSSACRDKEKFDLTLDVAESEIEVVGKRLGSSCRQLVSWDGPEITLEQGKGSYFRIVLQEPKTRKIDARGVAPAMAGPVRHVRLSFRSEPPGSEIWLNDEKLDYRTNTRLSVPYAENMEDEKRFLVRQQGLVNCYGTIALPADAADVECIHRDVK
jgi:hypothetical protein